MFFWKKRKQQSFENKFQELDATVLSERDYKNSKKIEQYVVEQLEQIIEIARELDEEKAEYRVVTAYLNDIQLLEELPEEERKRINEIALNVVQLNKARNDFLNSAKKLSDAQFAQMQQMEKEIPDAIKRLAANEAYRDTVKKDMKYLEREKSEWTLRKEYLGHQQKGLKNLLYITVGVAATVAVIIAFLQLAMGMDCFYAWMLLLLVSALSIFGIFIRIQNDQSEISMAERCQNRAIVLQNKVKIKFVNIENAVEYACEKYHVRNSDELNDQWKYYMEAVREQEKYQRTNEDLEYFNGRLVRELLKYKLYDAQIWVSQAVAFLDSKEMVEIKHALIGRRQKLREQIEYNLQVISSQKKDVEKVLGKVGKMRPRVEEILFAIEKTIEAE